jgi:hypothetical protein
MDFPQKVAFSGVFELPLLRNAHFFKKTTYLPSPFSGYLPDIRRFQLSITFSSAPLSAGPLIAN